MPRFLLRRSLTLGILVFCFSAARSAEGQCTGCPNHSFGPAVRSADVGDRPAGLTSADFNEDSYLDLVTNNGALMLGTPSGAFRSVGFTSPGAGGIAVASADLDGDGHADLLALNSNLVVVRLGQGDGTFREVPDSSTSGFVEFIAPADFNGDGVTDVAVAGLMDQPLEILLGHGDGTFGPPTGFGERAQPGGLTVGDFDEDGDPDVAIGQFDPPGIMFFRGNGDGSFALPDLLVATSIDAITTDDVNGDDHADLVTLGDSGNISTFLGRGDGSFDAEISSPTPIIPYAFALADFDRDGDQDAAVAGYYDQLALLAGNGDGTFGSPTAYSVGASPHGALAADFDSDGSFDLATANTDSDNVTVLFGTGSGQFEQPKVYSLPSRSRSIATGDLNGDGIADLVSGGEGTLNIAVLLGEAGGAFAAPMLSSAGQDVASLALADVNHDEALDLVVGTAPPGISADPSHLRLFLGNGDGSFATGAVYLLRDFVFSLALGDVNGDTHLDVAVSQSGTITPFLGRGDGAFDPGPAFGDGSAWGSILSSDVDADGKLDLIATHHDGLSGVVVFRGAGDGTFLDPWSYPIPGTPIHVVTGDFDADGSKDLAVARLEGFGQGVSILLGHGDGTFEPAGDFSAGQGTSYLLVRDLNGDGHSDLAAVSTAGSDISLLTGGGDGTFEFNARFAMPRVPFSAVAEDFDGDGRVDLAIGADGVTVLTNTSCLPRRIAVSHSVTTCSLPGTSFDTQPVVGVYDDGDNLITCDDGFVTAHLVPPDGSPEAMLGGDSTVPVILGEATFLDLSVDTPGDGYVLRFVHPVAGEARGLPFSIGAPPEPPVASNDGPFCPGEDLRLNASAVQGATYHWAGPNGFSSSARTPLIEAASSAAAGTYTVTVTRAGCTSSQATTVVELDPPLPAPVVSGYHVVCSGGRLLLTAAGFADSYQWYIDGEAIPGATGPEFTIGFTSPSVEGSFTVVGILESGCRTAISEPFAVTVVPCSALGEAIAVDSLPNGALSNGNAVLDPGETAVVAPSWRNISTEALTLDGSASSFSGPPGPEYALRDASAEYGSISVGETKSCTSSGDCYEAFVSEPLERPASHWDARLDETLSTGDPAAVWMLHIGESFADVAVESAFYPSIETIFHHGLTSGCAFRVYCPRSALTRAQVAILLLRALRGASYQPPPATGQRFTDVPASAFAAAWIEQLAHTGITKGCGEMTYCPEQAVTRAQAAVLLLRAKHHPLFTPPAATGLFSDVPADDPYAPWIEQLYHEGITAGCGGGRFCPTEQTTREAIAAFLTKAFELRLYEP